MEDDTVITPSQEHMHVLWSLRTGSFFTVTVGDPGDHGAVVTGVHGTGDPLAEITAGLVGAVHMTKLGMFVMGL